MNYFEAQKKCVNTCGKELNPPKDLVFHKPDEIENIDINFSYFTIEKTCYDHEDNFESFQVFTHFPHLIIF